MLLAVDPDRPPAETRDALDAVFAQWPNAEVQVKAEFTAGITARIDQTLNLVYGLLALTVLIALLGITNTLALSVHERTRELGLLRALGMHRRQLRRTVRWELLLIAILGAALGTALAIGGGWGVVRALDDQGITRLTLPAAPLTVIVGMAGLAGVPAATVPAWRAARLDVLKAIVSE